MRVSRRRLPQEAVPGGIGHEDSPQYRHTLRSSGTRGLRSVSWLLAAALGDRRTTRMILGANRRLTLKGPEPTRGSLIVLAGEQTPDGEPGAASLSRCLHAADTFNKGHFEVICVSGGASSRSAAPAAPALAEQMAHRLESLGVPRRAILVDAASGSTRQSAEFSAGQRRRLPAPWALITSDFHSYRAVRCFRRTGLAVESWPGPDLETSAGGIRPDVCGCGAKILEEIAKILLYRWKGWLA